MPEYDEKQSSGSITSSRGSLADNHYANRTLSDNPAALYIADLGSKESRRVAVSRLNRVAKMVGASDWTRVDWSMLDRPFLYATREYLGSCDAATLNGICSMLKGVARQAWDLKIITAEAYQRIKETKPLRVERKPRHRNIQPVEIRAMLDEHSDHADQGRIASVRDAALLAVAYGTGARRAELVAMDIEDVSLQDQTIRIRRGKGNKERFAPLPPFAIELLQPWLAVLDTAAGRNTGALFVRIRAGNQLTDSRLTSQSVYEFVKRWTAQLGLEIGKPHDLRASLITRLLDAGEDLTTVAAYVGHSSVTTTQRYDMSAARRVARAARKVDV